MKRAAFLLFFLLCAAEGSKIVEADRLYFARDENDNEERSIRLLKEVLESEPDNEAALWRMARAYKWKGDLAAGEKEKLSLYEEARRWAERALQADPKSVGGHFLLGVAYGRIGETRGVLRSLSLVGPIQREMEAVLAADPENDGAHHVLGVMYRKLPRLFGGSLKKSEEELRRAIRSNPRSTIHLRELALTLLEEERGSEAKEALRALMEIKEPSDPVQAKIDRREAESLLADPRLSNHR